MRGSLVGILALVTVFGALPAHADPVNFGTNTSQYANDGECDDRRFFGEGMAERLGLESIGMDARDCEKLYQSQSIQLWIQADAKAATQGLKLDFGNNSSENANDNECDDIRFEGLGVASMTKTEDIGKDANDCSRMHEFGLIFLRNYK